MYIYTYCCAIRGISVSTCTAVCVAIAVDGAADGAAAVASAVASALPSMELVGIVVTCCRAGHGRGGGEEGNED